MNYFIWGASQTHGPHHVAWGWPLDPACLMQANLTGVDFPFLGNSDFKSCFTDIESFKSVWRLSWIGTGLSVARISTLSSSSRFRVSLGLGLSQGLWPPEGRPVHLQSLQHAFSHQAGAATWVRKTPSSLPTSRVEYWLCFGHFWTNA